RSSRGLPPGARWERCLEYEVILPQPFPSREMSAQEGAWSIRDTGPYSARNSSKGALIAEAGRVFQALHDGLTVPEVRHRVLEGTLLVQRSRFTRERIWDALHHRYLAHHVAWIIHDLTRAW